MDSQLSNFSSKLLAVTLLWVLVLSGLVLPLSTTAKALQQGGTSGASGVSHQGVISSNTLSPSHSQTPSWLTSLLRNHQSEVSRSQFTARKGAMPMYIALGKVNVKSQTPGNTIYYSPGEIRNAYNATSLLNTGDNGSGVTIAIVDAYGDPYIQDELNNFSEQFGIPTTTVNVICVDGPCNYYNGVAFGWSTEVALDVEWAHAMAPGARLNLYVGSSNYQPLYDAVAAAVAGTNGTSPYSPSSIVSMSWGSPENDFGQSAGVSPLYGENYPWLNQVFQQGEAENITFFASTGDWGAYDQTYGQTSPYGGAIYPSTDPFVTAVGGTSLYMNTTSGYLEFPTANATGGYGYETGWSWNNWYQWGTGGGFSTLFGRPSWQIGPGLSGSQTRGAADVSWVGDPQTGVIVCVDGAYEVVGGTSVGSPSWAGAMALVDSRAGHSLGFINPSLYSIMDNSSRYTKAFHDVTVGDSDPLQAGPGWDPLTGMGSPNVGELSLYLSQPSTGLKVVASNNVPRGSSADYSSVQIRALVYNGTEEVTNGTASAEVTSADGVSLGVVPMTYDGVMWSATFPINSTDAPGMWTATVRVASGLLVGSGDTTFSVGDGVMMFGPSGPNWFVGNTLPISAEVTEPNGTFVTEGSFNATFYHLSPSGPVEGVARLTYNSIFEDWEGTFAVNSSRDQGAWIVEIGGTDSNGTRAAPAYAWLNVGLSGYTFTGGPTFVLGDSLNIYSFPASTGAYNATIWFNGTSLGTVPLTYLVGDLWNGTFVISPSDPVGFYSVVVTGNDGLGNADYFETTVRVAPLNLDVNAAVSLATTEVTSNEIALAGISYPNSTVMKVGSVEAFTSSGYQLPLTYNASSEEFNAMIPINTLPPGTYYITIIAYDPFGDFGGGVTSFQLLPVPHGPSSTSVSCFETELVANNQTQCTAFVSGYNPTGNVTWSYSDPGIFTGAVSFSPDWCLLSAGQCQVNVRGVTFGRAEVTATYSGDYWNNASSGAEDLTVVPIPNTNLPTNAFDDTYYSYACPGNLTGCSLPGGVGTSWGGIFKVANYSGTLNVTISDCCFEGDFYSLWQTNDSAGLSGWTRVGTTQQVRTGVELWAPGFDPAWTGNGTRYSSTTFFVHLNGTMLFSVRDELFDSMVNLLGSDCGGQSVVTEGCNTTGIYVSPGWSPAGYFVSFSSAGTSGTLEGGWTSWPPSLGVTVEVAGSTYPNGTLAFLAIEDMFDSQPAGTGTPDLANSSFYDVRIWGIADGMAYVCVNSVSITNETTMEYYNSTGGNWVLSSTTFGPPDTLCGSIPVSALEGTFIVTGAPPPALDESLTPPVPPTEVTIGTIRALNFTFTNNLRSRLSAIVWFQVDNATTGQEVAVVGTSLTLDPFQRGSVYLALSTFSPGAYKVTAFAVTVNGVVLSPNVVKSVAL